MAPSQNGTAASAGGASRQTIRSNGTTATHHCRPVVVPVVPLPFVKQQNNRTRRPAAPVVVPSPSTPIVPSVQNSCSTTSPPPVPQNATNAATSSESSAAPMSQETSASSTPNAVQIRPGSVAAPVPSRKSEQVPATREPLQVAPHTSNSSPTATASPGSMNGVSHPHPPPFSGPLLKGRAMPPPPGFHPRHFQHQPHPSDGSVIFGAPPDSNHTSPGPLSAGIYPPPGSIPYPGLPVFAPPPGHFRRPGPGPEQVPLPLPVVTMAPNHGYEPITPGSHNGSFRSFQEPGFPAPREPGYHSSQEPSQAMLATGPASGPPNGVFPNGAHFSGRHPNGPNGVPNGQPHGFPTGDSHNGQHHGSLNGQFPTPPHGGITNGFGQHTVRGGPHPPVQPIPTPRHFADLHRQEIMAYLMSSFNNPATADCRIEVNLWPRSDQQLRSPIAVSGHRLIFGFSPTLREQLGMSRFSFDLEDKYARSDVLEMCLASLYSMNLPDDGSLGRFDIAAGFIAAGHFLQLGHIVEKGTEDLIPLIFGWGVLEQALGLCLDRGFALFSNLDVEAGPRTDFAFRYGKAAERIINCISQYIINNFPSDFRLDTSCPDPPYSRIPAVSPDESSAPRMPNSRATNPALSSIRFGDISMPSPSAATVDPNTVPGEARVDGRVNSADNVLSIVLMNLPFEVLKHVMASISGRMTAQDHRKVVFDLVAEREARREKAFEAIIEGRAPHAPQRLRPRLGLPQPPGQSDGPWDVLGWRESVSGTDEAPSIVRSWVCYA